MKNERMNVDDFLEMQRKHYEEMWDMGLRTLAWPQYPDPIRIWDGKRIIFCEYSSQVILYRKCEYCRNDSLTSLDENNCCATCSAHVEM